MAFVTSLLKRIFTWWNGQTVGTWLYTARKGIKVGSDSQGNIYYKTKSDKVSLERRWVIYNGESDASRIPPEWHAWLHRMVDDAPEDKPLKEKPWEKEHISNQTGLNTGYAPKGSLARKGDAVRAKATGDYEAWSPDKL